MSIPWHKAIIWFVGCWILWCGLGYVWHLSGEPRGLLAISWMLMFSSIVPLVMKAMNWLLEPR